MRRLERSWWIAGIVLALGGGLPSSPAAAATPPINNNYLDSSIVTQASTTGTAAFFTDTEDTAEATTQADLFDPLQTGLAGSGGGPEPARCNGTSYGKTIWYDLRPRLTGGVEFDTAGFGSAISLYRYDTATSKLGRRIACNVSRGLENDFPVPVDLLKRDRYTVQIGGLSTPTGVLGGQLEVKMSWYTDRDDDTVFDVLDKCPTLPGVTRYGGCPPTIHPVARFSWDTLGTSIRLMMARIEQVPAGATVTVSCPKCGLTQTARLGAHGSTATLNAFVGKTLAPDDTIEVYTTKRASGTGQYRYGAIGSYISYTVTNASLADRVSRCLMPGSLIPRTTCPPGGKHPLSSRAARRPTVMVR